MKKGDRSRVQAVAKLVDTPPVLDPTSLIASPSKVSLPSTNSKSSKNASKSSASKSNASSKTVVSGKNHDAIAKGAVFRCSCFNHSGDNKHCKKCVYNPIWNESIDEDDEKYENTGEEDEEDDQFIIDSDIDDYANLSDLDGSEDELRTSFQKNSAPIKNRILGGPTPPDTTLMSERRC